MRLFTTVVLFMVSQGLLSCGQKGPLELPGTLVLRAAAPPAVEAVGWLLGGPQVLQPARLSALPSIGN